jgi:hypothetical protein
VSEFVKATYTWEVGDWNNVLSMGNDTGDYITTLAVMNPSGSFNDYVKVGLHRVDPVTDAVSFSDSTTGSTAAGAYVVGNDFFAPHLAYTNGRWIGMWPHFTDGTDAASYWIGVWREVGGAIVFDVNEDVVVPYPHSLGSTSYGWILGVLDDCVIVNTAYVIGADRRFYSRVIPVGPGSGASASTTDYLISPVDLTYPANWMPYSASSIIVYWNYSTAPGSYILGKDGSVATGPSVTSGWWYETDADPGGHHDLIDGDLYRWVVEGGASGFRRFGPTGDLLAAAPAYVPSKISGDSAQYAMVRFGGVIWASDYKNFAGGFPTSFHGVITRDVFGTQTDYIHPGGFPGISNSTTVLNVARTASKLVAVGTAGTTTSFWVSTETEAELLGVEPALRLNQRGDSLGIEASPRLGGQVDTGNNPGSLQYNAAPRLAEGGNVHR